MWSHPTLLKTAMKGKNSSIAMGDQERSKSQTAWLMNSGTLLFYPHICLLGLNKSKKPAWHRHVSRFQTCYPGLVLANVQPDCNPCDKPLEGIMQSKKGLTFWYFNVSLDKQLKWSNFYHLSVKHIIYLISKKINAQISPWAQCPLKNGDRLCQISPIGLRSVLFYLLRLW
jgi:hypothetical protein